MRDVGCVRVPQCNGNCNVSCLTGWNTTLNATYINQLYQAQAGGVCHIPGVMTSFAPATLSSSSSSPLYASYLQHDIPLQSNFVDLISGDSILDGDTTNVSFVDNQLVSTAGTDGDTEYNPVPTNVIPSSVAGAMCVRYYLSTYSNYDNLANAIFGAGSQPQNNIVSLFVTGSGYLGGETSTTSSQVSIYIVPLNTYVHLCITWNATVLTVYSNGSQMVSGALAQPLTAPVQPVLLFIRAYVIP